LDITTVIDLSLIRNESLDRIDKEFVRIITYPRADWVLFRKRIDALLEKGIRAVILDGPVQIGRFHIMGKGTNSIVIKGLYNDDVVVVKLLRMDSSRDSLSLEAEIIKKILDAYPRDKLVPKLIGSNDWMIIQEYIQGVNMFDFLSDEIYHLGMKDVSRALSRVLYKGFLLDKLNIDHGELSRPKSHVIFMEPEFEPVFIDFESAKYRENPRNFSSLIQAIFIRHPSSEYLCELYNLNLEKIRRFVSIYNESRTEDTVKYVISKIFNL